MALQPPPPAAVRSPVHRPPRGGLLLPACSRTCASAGFGVLIEQVVREQAPHLSHVATPFARLHRDVPLDCVCQMQERPELDRYGMVAITLSLGGVDS
jgi:hypothetical protein